MLKKFSQLALLALLWCILPTHFQTANAVDVLWQPGVGNDLNDTAPGLVPGAKIRETGLLVYKENPDELIMKIVMNDTFEDKPFTGKGRNMAMWIYWPQNYCWSKEKANCDGLFTVGDPINPASYPSSKSSEYVVVQKHNKASNVDIKSTECKTPWWIESTYKSRDTWAFAVSITCLGIPKEFGWYAFSQIDIGQKDIVSDFTQVQTITYPFHELAKSAYSSVTNSKEKTDLIYTLRNLTKSFNLQSKGVKNSILKSKNLSSAKKRTYQATLKKFDDYSRTLDGKISELEALPYNEDFKSTALKLIADHQDWNKKLRDVLNTLVKQ